MKSNIATDKNRLAKIKMRKWARRIPNNAVLINILAEMERPLRRDFLRVITPHLRFRPISLEEMEQ